MLGAQAFKFLLCLHLGDTWWESEIEQKFRSADGATAMLELLAAQPDCVAYINKRGCSWVPWGDAEITSHTGPALARVAAFTNDEQVHFTAS